MAHCEQDIVAVPKADTGEGTHDGTYGPLPQLSAEIHGELIPLHQCHDAVVTLPLALTHTLPRCNEPKNIAPASALAWMTTTGHIVLDGWVWEYSGGVGV